MKQEDKRRFERNIKLHYIIASTMWMRFFVPVIALFYIASQVSLEEFAIIFAVFHLAILVLEIPSGVFADLLGRKRTLLLSRSLYVIEIALLCFTNGFWPFLIAKLISGFGLSMGSGTNSSLLYESLKKLGREKEHKKISGSVAMVSQITMAVVFIIGAYLFSLNNKLPAYVSLPLIFIGFVLTFFLKEPYTPTKKATIKNSITHLKEGLSYFFKHKKIVGITVYSLPIAALISITLTLSSAYLEAIAIPVGLIGIVAFVGQMFSAFSSRKADYFEKKFGLGKTFVILHILTLISVGVMAAAFPYIGVFFYLLIPFASGLFNISINHYMNEEVSEHHRATMLSVRNFFSSLMIFLMYPVVGFLIGWEGYLYGYGALGVLLVLGAIWYYAKYHRNVMDL